MGSGDPFLYQLWLFLLTRVPDNQALVETMTGVLCAAMPYGWYRALQELLPRRWALGGAPMPMPWCCMRCSSTLAWASPFQCSFSPSAGRSMP